MNLIIKGKSYRWKLSGYVVTKDTRLRSELHLRVRKFLKKKFPLEVILEEVKLPKVKLYLDFFLPESKIVVEANGRQHTQYIPHFHQNIITFQKSLQRDREKKEIIEGNGMRFIALNYDETEEQWRTRF
jgi:very-short-patch-repair endonuclease